MLRVIALGALAALAGCTVKDSCADGTVLVALTLNGDSAQADELVVDVALDGDAPRESTLAHAPGVAGGNVLVKFPSGYPRGHTVAVTIAARTGGVVVGSGTGSIVLAGGCEALTLTVESSGVDGGGGDDLATPDDLTTPSPDMVCVPTTENCFNGIDDDCDGHTDCDDPDCTTVAVCVPPVTGTFVIGTTLATASLCPASYSSLEVIDSGLNAAANCSSGCSCGVTCLTQIGNLGGPGGSCTTDTYNQIAVLTNTACASWNSNQWDKSLNVHQLVTPSMCQASGTALVPTASWAASKRVCSTALQGGGCSSGKVCVPITPGPNCEVAAGSATCDTGYNAVSGPWYTGFDDTRNCSCSCGSPTGSCGTQVTLYTDGNCMTAPASFAATSSDNITCNVGATTYLSGKIVASPTCGGPTYTPHGMLTPTGLQTLCCAP